MNFLNLLKKIWLYLGPFYLSLFFCFLMVSLKKFKKGIIYLFLLINLTFSLKTYFIHTSLLINDYFKFRKPFREKMDQVSSNQYSFLLEIESLLPRDKNICYPWPSDIAGRYARQFLYPRKVNLEAKSLENCHFLVLDFSIKKGEYELASQLKREDELIFSNHLGKVFEINHDD
jgi:hypothetical protein